MINISLSSLLFLILNGRERRGGEKNIIICLFRKKLK